jgi:hypothetical protein
MVPSRAAAQRVPSALRAAIWERITWICTSDNPTVAFRRSACGLLEIAFQARDEHKKGQHLRLK